MKIYSYAQECPCCWHKIECVTGINMDNAPKPNDCSVCIKCGAICIFDEDMALKLVPDTSGDDWYEARRLQKKVRELRGLPV